MTKQLPAFEKSPLSEVVFGVFFKPLELRLPHSGVYWSRIRKEFPKCQHASPHGPLLENGLPVPRIWFVSEDDKYLIQYQPNFFLFNWRRTLGSREYPHYSSNSDQFFAEFDRYLEFLQDESLGEPDYDRCELTYINHIPKGEGWIDVAEVGDVVPGILPGLPAELGSQLDGVNCTFAYKLPEDFGQLTVSLKHATRNTDKCPLLVLEISARGLGGDASEARIKEWFALAHETIILTFAGITSDQLQREQWGRTEKEGK